MSDDLTLKPWIGASNADYEVYAYPASGTEFRRAPLKPFLEKRGAGSLFLSVMEGKLPPGCVVAGSYMADVVGGITTANDIDLFFLSSEAFDETVRSLLREGFTPRPESKAVVDMYMKGLRYGKALDEQAVLGFDPPGPFVGVLKPVQAIKIAWYDSAEHVIDNFDFTVTQFAYDVGTGDLVFNPAGALDLAAKRLVQHRVEFQATVEKRLARYRAKGFEPTPSFTLIGGCDNRPLDDVHPNGRL